MSAIKFANNASATYNQFIRYLIELNIAAHDAAGFCRLVEHGITDGESPWSQGLALHGFIDR